MINKTITFVIAASTLCLAGCTPTTAVNAPGYRANYVHSNVYSPPAYGYSEHSYKAGMDNRWYSGRPYYNESMRAYRYNRHNINSTSVNLGSQSNRIRNYRYNQATYNSTYRPASSSSHSTTSVQSNMTNTNVESNSNMTNANVQSQSSMSKGTVQSNSKGSTNGTTSGVSTKKTSSHAGSMSHNGTAQTGGY